MADGDKIVRLPDDDDRVTPRNQDQRGQTGRIIDAEKLQNDVEAALTTAGGVKKPGETSGDTEFTPEGGEEVDALKAQLAREKRRADAAEERAATATETAGVALDAKTQSDLNTLKTAKNHLTEQQEELKRRLSVAHADGDFDSIADINLKMTQSAVQMSNIEGGIVALENAPKQREALARRGEPGDQKFQAVTKGMDPAAKKWFRDNPEYYQDDRKLQRVIAAHGMVTTSDDPPEVNTPEYFEAVEAALKDPKFTTRTGGSGGDGDEGNDDNQGDEALSDASQGNRRRGEAPPASAPVTRDGRGTGSTRNPGREIRLTQAEQDAARDSGLTNEEYARNKRALIREDRLGPNAQNRNRMH